MHELGYVQLRTLHTLIHERHPPSKFAIVERQQLWRNSSQILELRNKHPTDHTPHRLQHRQALDRRFPQRVFHKLRILRCRFPSIDSCNFAIKVSVAQTENKCEEIPTQHATLPIGFESLLNG
jgi:hypothetical protein